MQYCQTPAAKWLQAFKNKQKKKKNAPCSQPRYHDWIQQITLLPQQSHCDQLIFQERSSDRSSATTVLVVSSGNIFLIHSIAKRFLVISVAKSPPEMTLLPKQKLLTNDHVN